MLISGFVDAEVDKTLHEIRIHEDETRRAKVFENTILISEVSRLLNEEGRNILGYN
jgi:hypothetical protein